MRKQMKLKKLLSGLKVPYTVAGYSDKWEIVVTGQAVFLDSINKYVHVNFCSSMALRELGLEEKHIKKFKRIINREGKACLRARNRYKLECWQKEL